MSTATGSRTVPNRASGDPRRVLTSIGALIGALAALFGVGLILGFAFVGVHGGGLIQGWDDRVGAWELHHRAGLVGAAKVVAFLGDAPKLAVIAVVLTAIWFAATRSIRSLVPLAAYLGGEFLVFIIRHVITRHRPPTANFPAPGAVPGVHETSYSYPSGHSVAVTSVLIALAATAWITHRWLWPWILAVPAALFTLDTRLILGVHWFSDVTFGFVLGVAWGVTVALVAQRLDWDDVLAVVPGRTRSNRA